MTPIEKEPKLLENKRKRKLKGNLSEDSKARKKICTK